MKNIVNWELKKQLYRSRFMMLALPMILVVMLITTAIFPVKDGMFLIYGVLLIWGTVWPIVSSILNLVGDLLNPTYLLERSTSRNHLPVFLTQIGCNIIYFLMATFVAVAGEAILAQFSTENESFFTVWISRSYIILMVEFTFLYPVGITFAYLVGAKFSQSKLIRGFMMIVAGVLLYESSYYVNWNEVIFFVVALVAGIGMLLSANKLVETTI